MPSTEHQPAQIKESDFARQALQKQSGFLNDFWLFFRSNKKWWLTPIVVTLLFIAVLVVLGSTAAAPFIYTLF
jgi:hypothetical protein